MFLCLPIVFGVGQSLKPEGTGEQRVCPRCHNHSCVQVKQRKRFELFWVPLIPFKAKHLWMCSVCRYAYQADAPSKDAPASAQYGEQRQQQGHAAGGGKGYDVGYHGQQQPVGAKV
ncbi:uncharacterized protein JCM10292_001816 [Rhodotorula paludigena]|uniref:uncharacterized protein n=1 Tax=Rhodotorula paludigena TaxID=86838 RepID=UPI0031732D99